MIKIKLLITGTGTHRFYTCVLELFDVREDIDAIIMTRNLSSIIEAYKQYVISNHEFMGNLETCLRVGSYVIPGGIKHSSIISELLHSASNLLILVNDTILRYAADVKLDWHVPHKELCKILSVLETVEVFVEIASVGLCGDTYRWIVIVCIQLLKAAIKFILLLKYKSGLLLTPTTPALKRGKHLHKKLTNGRTEQTDNIGASHRDNPSTYTLSRSGRAIRNIDSVTGGISRELFHQGSDKHCVGHPSVLQSSQILAEILHVSRPLAHLLSMFLCGQQSWKPWLVACSMDMTSAYIHNSGYKYTKYETKEIHRRTVILLLYLLRSPFYDKYTKKQLLMVTRTLASTIPGARLIIKPLLEYLPYWQRVYFYSWMQ